MSCRDRVSDGASTPRVADLPKDGFHVLRHTCASIMLEAGESVGTVARWLGHSSPAITLGYYAHFMPEAGSKGGRPLTDCWGGGEICMSVEAPQILRRADDGQFPPFGTSGSGSGLQRLKGQVA